MDIGAARFIPEPTGLRRTMTGNAISRAIGMVGTEDTGTITGGTVIMIAITTGNIIRGPLKTPGKTGEDACPTLAEEDYAGRAYIWHGVRIASRHGERVRA